MTLKRRVEIEYRLSDRGGAARGIADIGAAGERTRRQIGGFNRSVADVANRNDRAATSVRNLARNIAVMEGPLGGTAGRLSAVAAAIGAVGPAAFGAGAAVTGLVTALGFSTTASIKAESQYLRLTQMLKTTGSVSGQTSETIEALAQNIGEQTLASIREVRDAAAQLTTFKSISGDAFGRTLELAQDLASLGFGSLTSSTVQLAKALEDPVRGLTSLRRVGVSFTKDQEVLIASLAETGRLAEAQAEIFKVLEAQLGGAAEGQASGTAGAIDTMTERLGVLIETLGKAAGVAGLVEAGAVNAGRGFKIMSEQFDEGRTSAENYTAAQAKVLRLFEELEEAQSNGASGQIVGTLGEGGQIAARLSEDGNDVQRLRQDLLVAMEERDKWLAAWKKEIEDRKKAEDAARRAEEERKRAFEQNRDQGVADLGASLREETELLKLNDAERQKRIAADKAEATARRTIKGVTDAQIASLRALAAAEAEKQTALKAGATAEKARIQRDEKAQDAIRDTISGLDAEVAAQDRLIEAHARGSVAVEEVTALNVFLAEVREHGIHLTEKQEDAIADLIRRREKNKVALKDLNDSERENNRLLAEGERLTQSLRTPAERYADELARIDRLLQRQAISQETANRAIRAAQKEYREAEIEASRFATVVRDLAKTGVGGLINAAVSGNGIDLESFLRGTAGRIAGNLTDDLIDNITSGGGGGGLGIPGIPTQSQFLANIGTRVAETLGFTTTIMTPAGPQIALSSTGQAISAGFGAAPFGAIGSLGANLLGLNSGNLVVDTAAGLIGSVGGGALGSYIAGSALGGPVGAILGAFLATALGGAVFGDQDYPFANSEVEIVNGRVKRGTTTELDDGPSEEVNELTDSVVGALEGIFDSLGGSLSDIDDLIRIGVSSGRKGTLPEGIFIGGLDGKRGDFATGANFTGIEDTAEAYSRAVQVALLKSIREGVVDGLDADVAATMRVGLEKAIASDFVDEEQALGDIAFLAEFDRFVAEVGRLGNAEAQQIAAIEDATEQRARAELEYVRTFKERAERLFADDRGRQDNAVRSLQIYASGLIDQIVGGENAGVISGYALELRTGQEQIREFEQVLIETGVAAADAADMIQGGLDRLEDRVREDFINDLDAILDPTAARLREIEESRAELISQAGDLGLGRDAATLEKIDLVINQQLQEIGYGLDLAGNAVANFTASMADAVAAIDRELGEFEADANRAASLVSSLDQAIFSMNLSNAGGVAPGQQLADFTARMESLLETAEGGKDQEERDEAAREFISLSGQYTQFAADTLGMTEEQGRLAAWTRQSLESLKDVAQSEFDLAREQVDVLKEIRDRLQPANDNAATLSLSPVSYEASGDGQYRATSSGVVGVGYDLGYRPGIAMEILIALAAAGKRLPSGFGEGQLGQLRRDDSEINAIVSALGYDKGGVVTGSTQGRDGTLIVAKPGERVLSLAQTRQMDEIHANTNFRPMVAEISLLVAEERKAQRLRAAMFEEMRAARQDMREWRREWRVAARRHPGQLPLQAAGGF